MKTPDAEPNGMSGHFSLGDVVWFDYPHPDTARRCPRGPECYEELHRRTLPDDTFVLVMEAKRRTVLILAFIAATRSAPAHYRIMKLTTKKYRARADQQLPMYHTEANELCYACLDAVKTYPTHLAGDKNRVQGNFRIKQIDKAWRERNNYGPAPQREPGCCG